MKRGNKTFIDSPEQRVTAFISHWHTQWSIAHQKMGENVSFEIWAELVSEVDNDHFKEGSSSGSRDVFGSAADFDPENR